MKAFNSPPGKYNITERLFSLIDGLSTDRQFTLFRQLIKDNVATQLFKMIIDLSAEEKTQLLEKFEEVQVEEEQVKTINLDENNSLMRKNPRTICLVEAECRMAEKTFKSYIINISTDGVFLETKNRIGVGQKMALTFSLPNHPTPLKIAGQVARIEPEGVAVVFLALKQNQQEVIRIYIEKE
jgi:Tfp pilus assembly protein PilZ